LGDTLDALQQGRSVPVAYETRFLLQWPEHLGGGTVTIDLEGTMMLEPLLAID
jgi:hypothetical protein